VNNPDANRTPPAYELKDELARCCLPAAGRDTNLKLAWVNSICVIFLLIGIIRIVVEPVTLPPEQTAEKKEEPKAENDQPQVAVVIPQAPNINFSVPTIGPLVVPANLAAAPPLEPLRTTAVINSLNSTGTGGERPQPPYPKIALQQGQQGAIRLLLGGDAAGNVISVDVKESSGFPFLDRATVEFIKRRWHLPPGAGGQWFQTRITYQLQLN
jgi:protein TonB